MKYFCLIFCVLSLGCRDDKREYVRITSEKDSLQNMYVIYVLASDTNNVMMRNYWDNGKLQALSFFYQRKRIREWLRYFENGQLIYKGNFVDNKKEGKHFFYSETGKLKRIEQYVADDSSGVWEYYEKNEK